MVKWGDCDFKELEKLRDKLTELQLQMNDFMEACAKELAARLLRKAIKRTPVGQYPPGSGKVGGTLRRGWTAKTEEEAKSGGKSNATNYARSLPITKTGNMYEIEIINPVHYASYVEYGHRTRNHKGWVRGRFMLTISEQEIDAQAPKILEKKLRKKLEELFK
jgi:hypothetical protein